MEITDIIKFLNNDSLEKIFSIFSSMLSPAQNQQNYSQNDSYWQLPTYSASQSPPPPPNNTPNIMEILKLILPLLKNEKKSEPTPSPDFKSEILSLTKVKH